MHFTRHDLPEKVRSQMVELLNQQVAHCIEARLALKHAHWNVRGPHFKSLHELFDQVVDGLDSGIDDMAERAVQLGGLAEGTLRMVSDRSALPPFASTECDGLALARAVADLLARVGKNVRESITEAADAGDADTSDLFTGLSRELDKHLWMVEAHLFGQPEQGPVIGEGQPLLARKAGRLTGRSRSPRH